MSDKLVITKEREDFSNISICGEVDLCTSKDLQNTLEYIVGNSNSSLRIDCSRLNYIDSAGLNVLVNVVKQMKQTDMERGIHLVNMKKNIRNLFTITGVDKAFVMDTDHTF